MAKVCKSLGVLVKNACSKYFTCSIHASMLVSSMQASMYAGQCLVDKLPPAESATLPPQSRLLAPVAASGVKAMKLKHCSRLTTIKRPKRAITIILIVIKSKVFVIPLK